MRGYVDAGISQKVREAGGEIFGITSEPQTLAREARDHWGLDFETIGDPHHEVANECHDRGALSLYVNKKTSPSAGWSRHPNGFFQPGVLVLRNSGQILYRWRSRPQLTNQGGASGRPEATHVWEKSHAALMSDTHQDAPLDDEALLTPTAPWPLFALALLGNGNFVEFRQFEAPRGGSDYAAPRFFRALAKTVAIVAAWCAAVVWGPTPWILAASALWVAYIYPKFRATRREFAGDDSEQSPSD